jgi:CubicO group peptidase (beta-lactamase class C family)
MKISYSRHILALVALLSVIPATAPVAAQQLSPSITGKIDSLFSAYDKTDIPGCAVAVYRDGALIYAKGYGSADLEHEVPIRPNTLFNIGSMSKQFTATALILLQQEGKLSLDDDIRKYLPEIPQYGHVITIRHMLNHTSGLRDYLGLLVMAGHNEHDVTTPDDALRLIARQKGLDFEPGTRHAYSNTGYFLASQIVERVSGRTLRQFADERIFKPLGMTHTRFVDDHTEVVPNRAIGYSSDDDGTYHRDISNWEQTGDGGLYTSVEDLAKWDANFRDAKVGGPTLIVELQRRGVLNDGDTLDYAEGLYYDDVHGLTTIGHSGADGGYRSDMERIPSEHISVAVLSNNSDCDHRLVRKMFEVILGDRLPRLAADMKKAATAKATPVAMQSFDKKLFDAYAGDFELEEAPGFTVSFTRDGDKYFTQATGQDKVEMVPTSDSTFRLKGVNATVTFHRNGNNPVAHITFDQGGKHPAARVDGTLMKPEEMSRFAGRYRSTELETEYTLAVEDGKLVARNAQRAAVTFATPHAGGSTFIGDKPYLRSISFESAPGGTVSAMLVSFGRNDGIRFDRVQ